jgi:hypothetical protein
MFGARARRKNSLQRMAHAVPQGCARLGARAENFLAALIRFRDSKQKRARAVRRVRALLDARVAD